MENRSTSAVQSGELAALFDVEDWVELTLTAQRFLERLDLDGFMKKMRVADCIGRPHTHVISTLPASLNDDFRRLDLHGSAPVEMHVSRHGIPLAWEIRNLWDEGPIQPYLELKYLGIEAGWSVATRGEHSFSRIDVYSCDPGKFAQTDLHGELLLFSCYLNDAAPSLWARLTPETNIPTLTEREQQCLRWSASGKPAMRSA